MQEPLHPEACHLAASALQFVALLHDIEADTAHHTLSPPIKQLGLSPISTGPPSPLIVAQASLS